MLGMELLGGPADDGPIGLRYAAWFLACHLEEHGNFSVAIDEVRGSVQISQTVECLTRHGTGEHISAYDNLVNFLFNNFLKHGLESREVAMNVVDGSDSHETALNDRGSAAGALELTHEGGQGLDGFEGDGVVERDAHAAYGAVPGGAYQAGCGGFFGELFLDGFVAACHAEDYVHLGTRFAFDGAGVEAAIFDGVVEELGFGVVALGDGGDAAFGFDPFEDQTDDVDRESWRGVVERLFFYVRAVLQEGGEIFVGAFGKVFADDDDGGAAGAEIFLRGGGDQAEFLFVRGARGDVGGHVGDQGGVAGVRERFPLRAFNGVVGADVHVGSVGRKLHFVLAREAREFFGLAGGGDVVEDAFFQFADGFGGPHTGVEDVDRLAGEAEIHRSHGELHAAAALQEDHGVFVGDAHELAQAGFGVGNDAFKFGGAVTHFHDGHAAATPVEELFANALEHGKGQGAGAGVEVKCSFGGLSLGQMHGRSHDAKILSW